MNNSTNIESQQGLAKLSFWLTAAALAAAPLLSLLLFAALVICRRKGKETELRRITGVLLFVFGVLAAIEGIPPLPTLLQWIFCLTPFFNALVCCAVLSVSFFGIGEQSTDSLLLQEAKRQREQRYKHSKHMDLHSRLHAFIAGTTGSGKTTALLHYIKDSIRNGEPIFIISGKCGTGDKRSLLSMTKALAKRYGREMYLISFHPHETERRRYNPFRNMSAGAVADAIIACNDFTEPYYRDAMHFWLETVCEVLQCIGIPFSLEAICRFYEFEAFQGLLTELRDNGKLTAEEYRRYLSYKRYAEAAAEGRIKLLRLLHGDGSEVFGSGICAMDARLDKAIFFVDLDSFNYDAFTRLVGALAIHDICNMIASETEPEQPKRIICDEISCYATEKLLGIYSRARSFGFQVIAATQSIADLEKISPEYASVLLENSGQYLVLQLNDAADAERMAKIIGTFEDIETTHKTEGSALEGSGTKKVVHAFKVPPDTIKELRPLTAVYYNKSRPDEVVILAVTFIEP